MVATGIFITVGTAIGLIRALPQQIRLVRTRDTHGVSADAAATISVVSFAWATYGVLTGQLAVAMASSASGLMFGIVAVTALHMGRRASELRTTPVWLVVLLAAGTVWGASGLGLLLPISVLVANGPQLVVAYRERDLSGLSLGTWMLSVLEAAVWGSYGLIAGDGAILVYGILHLVTSGGVVLLRLVKKKGAGLRATPGFPPPARS